MSFILFNITTPLNQEKVAADPIVENTEIPTGGQEPTKSKIDADPLSKHSKAESEEDSHLVKDDEPKEHKEEIEGRSTFLLFDIFHYLTYNLYSPI